MTHGGGGTDSYLCMIYERLRLMRDLLADDGSIYVHLDERIGPYVRTLLDEIFSSLCFINEVTWKRSDAHSDIGQGAKHLGRVCDRILYYSRTPQSQILNMQFTPLPGTTVDRWYRHVEESTGRRYNKADMSGPGGAKKGNPVFAWNGVTRAWRYSKASMEKLESEGRIVYSESGMAYQKRYLDESKGVPLQDLWDDVKMLRGIHNNAETLDYATQKPEGLIERIVKTSSNKGDLVADFFCGSGTTLAVAEKLGRKWIGCDLGRFAIHTSRKRLIGVQREARKKGEAYRSFEILNLGKYERQYFVGIDPNLPEPQRSEQSDRREDHYLNLILSAYKAERVIQSPPFHGRKGRTWVVVGPIDAPVTHSQILEILATCRKLKIAAVDVLGFEFEMGLAPNLLDDARKQGVNVMPKCIPKCVFDKRAVDAGQVQFYDLAYVEAKAQVQGLTVRVTLADFSVYYRQEDIDTLGQKLKPGGSKVTVANGQVVKLSKDKKGIVTPEVLTKVWTDWVDYWAVDFDYSTPELLTEVVGDVEVRRTTGNYIFENEWQSFRTRKDRTLELTSAAHQYPKKGAYRIAVKVIDIFGNDTTKVIGVTI